MTLLEQILDQVVAVGVTLGAALIPVIGGYLISAIQAWGAQQKNKWITGITQQVTEAAYKAVAHVDQVYAAEHRGADGKLSAERSKAAFAMAINSIIDQLPNDVLNAIKKLAGGESKVVAFLTPSVEAAVKQRKDSDSWRAGS